MRQSIPAPPAMVSVLGILALVLGCTPGNPPNRAAGSQPKITYTAPSKAGTSTAAEVTPSESRLQYPELDNAQYFAKFRADLSKSFQEAIAAHKEAKAAPIRQLAKACKSAVEELRRRQWDPPTLKTEIDCLITQLDEANRAILEALMEKEFPWSKAEGFAPHRPESPSWRPTRLRGWRTGRRCCSTTLLPAWRGTAIEPKRSWAGTSSQGASTQTPLQKLL